MVSFKLGEGLSLTRIMRSFAYLVSCLFFEFVFLSGNAQNMNGQVVDIKSMDPLAGITVVNVHQDKTIVTDEDGNFSLAANPDELIEFRGEGYKLYKVRVPKGQLPPFFKIGLEQAPDSIWLATKDKPRNYYEDSLQYYNLYKKELDFKKLSTLEMIQHPFSAMSKHNRQIWAFQEEFNWFQQEKYINYTFNEKIVNNLTGLSGDSVQRYMQMFRPTYYQLRNMSEYTFYNYIKNTVEIYRRRGAKSKMSPGRVSH